MRQAFLRRIEYDILAPWLESNPFKEEPPFSTPSRKGFDMSGSPLTSLGIVLAVALLTSVASRRLKIPLIVLEILAGIMLGDSWLGLVVYDPYLEFMSGFGLIYLLFLAGLEMGIREVKWESVLLALSSFLVPFILGAALGSMWGIEPMFMGALLSTTSVGIVLPVIRELKLEATLKRMSLESALLVDALSMFLLTISLELVKGTPSSSIALSLAFSLSLFVLPLLVKIHKVKMFLSRWLAAETHFKHEVRFCLALMVIMAILFEILGFHAILGSFLAGLIVSELTEEGGILREKLLGVGYGLFIPLFFITAGAATNLPLLLRPEYVGLVPMLLLTGFGGKIIGTSLTARVLGLGPRIGLGISFLHSARLSLIIAGAKLGLDLGLIANELYSAIVIFALITVLVPSALSKALLTHEHD